MTDMNKEIRRVGRVYRTSPHSIELISRFVYSEEDHSSISLTALFKLFAAESSKRLHPSRCPNYPTEYKYPTSSPTQTSAIPEKKKNQEERKKEKIPYHTIANKLENDDAYGELFTPDVQFIIAFRKVVSRSGEYIFSLPDRVIVITLMTWAAETEHDLQISSLSATNSGARYPNKVLSYRNHDNDTKLMIPATADLTHHAGHIITRDWAAHRKLVKDDQGRLQCSY